MRKDAITFIREKGLYDEYKKWQANDNINYHKNRYRAIRFQNTIEKHGDFYRALTLNGIKFSPVKEYQRMPVEGKVTQVYQCNYKIDLTYLDKTVTVYYIFPDFVLCNLDLIFQQDHLSTIDFRLMQYYAIQQQLHGNTSSSTDQAS